MKITDLEVQKHKLKVQRDRYGNRVRNKVAYMAKRPVKVVSGGTRFLHFLIDLILYSAFVALISLGLNFIPDFPTEIGIIIESALILSFPLYFMITEHLFQASPGKLLFKHQVINEYAEKPALKTIVKRNLTRYIPIEVFSCFASRGWHDKWSNTFVVHKDEINELKKLLKEAKGESLADSLVTQ